jgi:acyl carrier protein
MVQEGARHLVLVGRSVPSPEAQAALETLHGAGATVVAAQADVACAEQIGAVIADVKSSMPPLRGIVHAAGVLDDAAFLQQSRERLRKVMAPKVEGAWNLHTATLDTPLDFFVLYSSVTAVHGTPGQANYAAANAFLDALAHFRRAQRLPAVSINWGPWAEVGMAARTYGDRGGSGAMMIPVERGLRILGKLLRDDRPQVAVMPYTADTLAAWAPRAARLPLLADLLSEAGHAAEAHGEEGRYARPSLDQEYVAPSSDTERAIAAIWERVLGIDRVGVHDDFFELGGHSLLAPQILVHLRKTFPITLSPEAMAEATTVAELASLVEGALVETVGSMSDEQAEQMLSAE